LRAFRPLIEATLKRVLIPACHHKNLQLELDVARTRMPDPFYEGGLDRGDLQKNQRQEWQSSAEG